MMTLQTNLSAQECQDRLRRVIEMELKPAPFLKHLLPWRVRYIGQIQANHFELYRRPYMNRQFFSVKLRGEFVEDPQGTRVEYEVDSHRAETMALIITLATGLTGLGFLGVALAKWLLPGQNANLTEFIVFGSGILLFATLHAVFANWLIHRERNSLTHFLAQTLKGICLARSA